MERRQITMNGTMLNIPQFFMRLSDRAVTEGLAVEVVSGDWDRQVFFNLVVAERSLDLSKLVGPSVGTVNGMPALRFETPAVCAATAI
jgi:hypothetical protein